MHHLTTLGQDTGRARNRVTRLRSPGCCVTPLTNWFAPFSANSNRRSNCLEISKAPKAPKRAIPASNITVHPPEQISHYQTLPKLYGKFMTSLCVKHKLLNAGCPVLTGCLA